MKQLLKALLLFLLPLQMFAQGETSTEKDITGLWKGTVVTPELKLPYELVITRKNGKLTGYSHTTFTVNGEEIVSVKKVTVRFKDEDIIIEDENMLFDNFREAAPKKIKQTNKVTLLDGGKVWRLSGTFEARAPRMLKPAEGTLDLVKQESPADTKLMAKLEELNLSNTISFAFNEPREPALVATNETKMITPKVEEKALANVPVKRPEVATDSLLIAKINSTPLPPIEMAKTEALQAPPVIIAAVTKPVITNRSATPKRNIPAPTVINTTAKIAAPVVPPAVVPERPIAKAVVTPKPPVNKPAAPVAKQPPAATVKPVVVNKPPVTTPAKTVAPPIAKVMPVNVIVAPALDLAKRKIETIQQLYIESDSLQFTLYDNGEVDGDTVSVALNGKTIVSRQGLNTTAFTKTVYITPDLGDSIQLIMYAENLGTLAPNTGLLVLLYDNKRQEIRFSGDLNKNAAITLRRKPKN